MSIETYDIVMLAVLLAATAFGAWKGLAWQLASLAAIFASYVVAYQFRHIFAEWIPVPAPWSIFLAMLLLYVLTSLGIWIIFQWVAKYIDRLKLKEFDRQIGALLGLAKGAILCVIITLFAVTLLGDQQRESIVNSRSGYYIAVLLNRSRGLMPEEIHEVLGPYLHALDDQLNQSAETSSEQGGGGGLDAPASESGVPVSIPF